MSGSSNNYLNISRAIASLLAPLVEVVVHDLKRHKIAFIAGHPGVRKIGEPSHLSPEDLKQPLGVIGPYKKVGEAGSEQKSISVVLGDKEDQPAYMLCINLRIAELVEAKDLLTSLLSLDQTKALSDHFTENWQDKINVFIKNYLSQRSSSVRQLTREEKKDLVLALRDHGGFNGKNAAQYIADSLKISRASVYNYLSEQG